MKKYILLSSLLLVPVGSAHAFQAAIAVVVKDGTLQPGTTAGFNVSSGTVVQFYPVNITSTGTWNITNATWTLTGITIKGTGTNNSTWTFTGGNTFAGNDTYNGTKTNNSTTTYTGGNNFYNGISVATSPAPNSNMFSVGLTSVTVKGTTDGTNPAAGDWFEWVTTGVVRSNAVALKNNVVTNLSTFTLTAGTWEISFGGGVEVGTATAAGFTLCLSKTVNACPNANSYANPINSVGELAMRNNITLSASDDDVVASPTYRWVSSSSQNFFLEVQLGFAAGNQFGYGWVQAIRSPH